MLPTCGRYAGVEWHHPPPVGSVDPNIRHRVTVCDLMTVSRATYIPNLNYCEGRMATELRHSECRGSV